MENNKEEFVLSGFFISSKFRACLFFFDTKDNFVFNSIFVIFENFGVQKIIERLFKKFQKAEQRL